MDNLRAGKASTPTNGTLNRGLVSQREGGNVATGTTSKLHELSSSQNIKDRTEQEPMEDTKVTPQKRGSEQVEVSMLLLKSAFNQKPLLRQKLLKANLYLTFINSLVSDSSIRTLNVSSNPTTHANI